MIPSIGCYVPPSVEPTHDPQFSNQIDAAGEIYMYERLIVNVKH